MITVSSKQLAHLKLLKFRAKSYFVMNVRLLLCNLKSHSDQNQNSGNKTYFSKIFHDTQVIIVIIIVFSS